MPDHIGPGNGSKFKAWTGHERLNDLCVKSLFIEPGSPWVNGTLESFNGKPRDELLNGEIFDTLLEVKTLNERWKIDYKTQRSHRALNYRPPAHETFEALDDPTHGDSFKKCRNPQPMAHYSHEL